MQKGFNKITPSGLVEMNLLTEREISFFYQNGFLIIVLKILKHSGKGNLVLFTKPFYWMDLSKKWS